MSGTKMVPVEVLREYPRGGEIHPVGARIDIPDYAVDDATKARPPFIRVVDPSEPEVDADFDATENALDLARALEAQYGFSLQPYAGRGSGPDGRIYKEDVERWAKEQGLLQDETAAPDAGDEEE